MTTSTILSDNGASSGSSGLKTTGGNDGTLVIQTTTAGGTATTAITVDATQIVTFANAPAGSGASLTNLNASNLASGTVPTARLGSGTASSSTYLRGDSTWATVAGGVTSWNGVTGAVTSTAAYDIGSFVNGRPQNTTAYAAGATIAGSSLYATFPASAYTGTAWKDLSNSTIPANCRELVNTGSWRCVTPAGNDGTPWGYCGLWVRYA